jgi:hypothetical protein
MLGVRSLRYGLRLYKSNPSQCLSMAGLDPATQTLPQLRLLGHRLKADDGESQRYDFSP